MSDKNFDEFVNTQIKRINEFSIWEDYFDNVLSKKITRKNLQFNILDKEWIEKWKECVEYEKIKEKCKTFSKKENAVLKKEISNILMNENAKKKLEDLGQLDCSKIKKESKNNKTKVNMAFFEETSNFIPIETLQFYYFNSKEKLYANGDFINGKCFITNTMFDKNEKKRVVIFEKSKHNNEINEALLTLEPNEDIKKVKQDLKDKTLEDMMNDNQLKNKIEIKAIIKKKEEKKNGNEEQRKKEQEEEEKKRKEEEEKKKKEDE